MILILKIVLALVMTVAPFALYKLIVTKRKESKNWDTLLTLMESKYPATLSFRRRAFVWIFRIYRKMKFSHNARKFFTYSVVVVMMLAQGVESFSLQLQPVLFASSFSFFTYWRFLMAAMGFSYEYSYLLFVLLPYVLSFLIAMSLFSYQVSDATLTYLHNNRTIAGLILIFAFFIAVISNGYYFVLTETLVILIIASFIYPNINLDELRKWRARWASDKKRSSRNKDASQLSKAA